MFESAIMCFNATFNSFLSSGNSFSSSSSVVDIKSEGSATTLNVRQNGHRMRNRS